MDDSPISFPVRLEVRKESLAIEIASEDGFAFFSPGGDMVKGSRIFDPQGPGHPQSFLTSVLPFSPNSFNVSNVETFAFC
jgi:hypothetical protein